MTGWGADGNARVHLEFLSQMAMLMFYVISGFGTYLYLSKKDIQSNGAVDYWAFIKRRFLGIAPSYYFCLIGILLTTGAYYLGPQIWKTIPVYFTFTQNLFSKHSGMLNGATWTIALLMQFYLIAPFMYKMVRKWGCKTYFPIMLISIGARFCIDSYISIKGYEDLYYVIANIRQLITTLDVFCAGMYAAKLTEYISVLKNIQKQNTTSRKSILFVMYSACLVAIYCGFRIGGQLAGTNWIPVTAWVYVWESIVGNLISIFVMLVFYAPFTYESVLGKGIQLVARYEYNTYLWHMILLTNIQGSAWYQWGLSKSPVILTIILYILALNVGAMLTKLLRKN